MAPAAPAAPQAARPATMSARTGVHAAAAASDTPNALGKQAASNRPFCAPLPTTYLRVAGNLDSEAAVPAVWDPLHPTGTSNFSSSTVLYDRNGVSTQAALFFRNQGAGWWEHHVMIGDQAQWPPLIEVVHGGRGHAAGHERVGPEQPVERSASPMGDHLRCTRTALAVEFLPRSHRRPSTGMPRAEDTYNYHVTLMGRSSRSNLEVNGRPGQAVNECASP
jgi:hypothetical protein